MERLNPPNPNPNYPTTTTDYRANASTTGHRRRQAASRHRPSRDVALWVRHRRPSDRIETLRARIAELEAENAEMRALLLTRKEPLMPERTYRLADGDYIMGDYTFMCDLDGWTDDLYEPTEIIEEEWELVRSRMITVGPLATCPRCEGEGVNPENHEPSGPEDVGYHYIDCPADCLDGITLRDDDPPWTHTASTRPADVWCGVAIALVSELADIHLDPNSIATLAYNHARNGRFAEALEVLAWPTA